MSWRIDRNPLFVKSLRERLRTRQALAAGAIALVLAVWMFSLVYFGATGRSLAEQREAAQGAMLPLLVLQGILMMFMGTGAVAHGIASEKEKGLIDYQRLTPMSENAKIAGYLFGLPVRETMMFAITMPFLIAAALMGGISLLGLLQIYLVFFSSVVLYHLTGYVAGMVSSRPRRASWFTRLMVLGLYLFLPRFASFGFTIFGYLTILPTFNRVARDEFGLSAAILDPDESWERFAFFGVEMHPTLFTLLLQGLLIATFVVVLRRKWRHDTMNSLSKPFAVGVYAAMQLLILGSLWNLFTDPQRVPLMRSAKEFGQGPFILAALFTTYWFLSLIAASWLLHIITPNPEGLLKGFLRARKLRQPRVPPTEDRADSLWCALALAAITGLCYTLLASLAGEHADFFESNPGGGGVLLPPLLFAAVLVGLQSVRQAFDSRGFLMLMGAIWLLPLLAAMVVGAAIGGAAAGYVGLPSPFAGLLFSTFSVFVDDTRGDWDLYPTLALIFNIGFTTWALRRSRRVSKRLRTRVFGETGGEAGS